MFVLRCEVVHEVGLEGLPVWVVGVSGPFVSENLIREPIRSVRFEEGNGPVDAGLIICKVVTADRKVDAAGIEECSTSVSVSIEVRRGCWPDLGGNRECRVWDVRCTDARHQVIFGVEEYSLSTFWFTV